MFFLFYHCKVLLKQVLNKYSNSGYSPPFCRCDSKERYSGDSLPSVFLDRKSTDNVYEGLFFSYSSSTRIFEISFLFETVSHKRSCSNNLIPFKYVPTYKFFNLIPCDWFLQ